MRSQALAVFVIALVGIGVVAGYLAGAGNRATAFKTLISTETSFQTVTMTAGVTSTLTSTCDVLSTLHCVVFQQLGACSPDDWVIPWSVPVGNSTEVQPADTPIPLENATSYGNSNRNLTVIVFSLPDGRYHFSVSPPNFFFDGPAIFTPDSGMVNVNGTSVLIGIQLSTVCETTTTIPG